MTFVSLDKSFKDAFYNKIDSLKSEEGDKLRKIEEKMFSGVKKEVETATKSVWSGTMAQHDVADTKIRY